jgi:hypothetical protein
MRPRSGKILLRVITPFTEVRKIYVYVDTHVYKL